MASKLIALTVLFVSYAAAAKDACANAIPPKYPFPEPAPGFKAHLLTNSLIKPRGIVFDKAGNLLVVQNGKGIVSLKLKDEGGICLSVASQKDVPMIDSDTRQPLTRTLKHAIQLNAEGTKIFTSTIDKVYSMDYDAATGETKNPITWVTGMDAGGHHWTRTLLLSKKAPGQMLVAQGSSVNLDMAALTKSSGHCQIRAFDISDPNKRAQRYSDGKVIGWGLRNSIGIDEDPITGGIWSNENGADDIKRNGKDIHENSPGEEVNFHGYLNGTAHPNQGANFGYPNCAAGWSIAEIPNNANLKVGKQFSYTTGQATVESDDTCADTKKYVAPRITLPSHWAPIDMRFNSLGTVAYMTSHGSWNKANVDGYKLFAVSFDGKGNPVHPASSTTAAIPILENKKLVGKFSFDGMTCGRDTCFRPTGLAFDAKGRLYMASDATGEIWVIGRDDDKSLDSLTLEKPGSLGEAVSVVRKDAPVLNVRRESTWESLWKMFGALKV